MIAINNLTKHFEGFTALKDVTCNIPEGCIYGMVGSNGAGKSTFLRLLSGVYKPDAGTIHIDEEEIYENTTLKNNIVFVPDELFFLSSSSMNRMAKLYKAAYTDYDMERFQNLVHSFNLDATKPINSFSKGMKRQAAIILALSAHPKYMFFDETFDGLDPVMRNVVKSLICDDVLNNKSTVIITSHSLRELEDLCDQLALLHKGGLVLQSDIENLKTSLFKVQVAFKDDYTLDLFKDLDSLYTSKTGSVSNLILRGNRESVIDSINKLNPVLLDVLPLSLEEVFTYEMESLGYSFEKMTEEISHEK